MIGKVYESNWLGRSLKNYQAMHAKTAQDKGVYNEFMAANTLTKARKILWGTKSKNMSCCTAGCCYSHCPRAIKGYKK